MAIDPNKLPRIWAKPFEVDIHEIAPENLTPIGDRYLVEELAVNEAVMFNDLLVIVEGEIKPSDDPRNPKANPMVEKRGVMPAVVVSVGNGHLLGLPDPPVVVNDKVERVPADVPIFLSPGDVILVDINNRGRALKIAGRTLRVVNQIDCLLKLEMRLIFRDGKWEREQ